MIGPRVELQLKYDLHGTATPTDGHALMLVPQDPYYCVEDASAGALTMTLRTIEIRANDRMDPQFVIQVQEEYIKKKNLMTY